MPYKTITIPLFNFTPRIWTAKSAMIKDIQKLYDIDVTSSLAGCTGITMELEHPEHGIEWALLVPSEWDDMIVYHEALHLAYHMLDYVGVHVSPDNHEMLAYLQGEIVDQIKRKVKFTKPKEAAAAQGDDPQSGQRENTG